MDRVHKALTPKKSEGPPRDIRAKFHYYCTKEQLLAAARGRESLTFQEPNYQLFADLSQLTINKWRAPGSNITAQPNNLPIGLPLLCALYISRLQTCFLICRWLAEYLHLADTPQGLEGPHCRSASCSHCKSSIPSTKNDHQSSNKWGHFISPDLDPEDSIDWL